MDIVESVMQFLIEHRSVIVIAHMLAAAVGVGAATVTDVLFFRFLRDYKISEDEAGIARALSHVIWIALGALILSGFMLYLPEAARLSDSAKFISKVIAIGVLIANGILLNAYISPRLSKISFNLPHVHKKGELHSLHRIAFASGGVSIVSWYFIFILGALRQFSLNLTEFLLIYAALLFLALAGSMLFERYFTVFHKKEE